MLISHVTHTHKRAERKARNIAGAEALAVARRPEVASSEKNPAAAGIRRFFPLGFRRMHLTLRTSPAGTKATCIYIYIYIYIHIYMHSEATQGKIPGGGIHHREKGEERG